MTLNLKSRYISLLNRFILVLHIGIFMSCARVNPVIDAKAPKPLYEDPIYQGAADPVIIWNKGEEKWFMFYTNRRASDTSAVGVEWVHGTRIGIAESTNGVKWVYRDTANINYRPYKEITHWAPDVIEHDGTYHMYLTIVPGIFRDWNHPRHIVHLTSGDLLNWDYESTLDLVNDKVIDADVFNMPDGSWRMWYNNEKDGKSIYYADSQDLYHWEDKGKAVKSRGEGPVVFEWNGYYWMIIDQWKGLGVYRSDDLDNWTLQEERLIEYPGDGKDDQAIGGHADVVVSEGRAFLYYFTHPGRNPHDPADSFEAKRSVIQVGELKFRDGKLMTDRNEEIVFSLKPL